MAVEAWRIHLRQNRFVWVQLKEMFRHLKMCPSLALYSNSPVVSRLKTALTAPVIEGCPALGIVGYTDPLVVAQPPL